jgi:hypothetical protein
VRVFSLLLPTRVEFENKTNSILNRTEYKHLKNGLTDYIDKIKEAISNWIVEMLKKTVLKLSPSSSVPDKLSVVFMIIGIVLFMAILIVAIVRITKAFEKKSRITEILGEKIDERTTPNSLRAKGADSYKSGDIRQAVRYDFIALLLLMHEKSLVYLDETKTNKEIYNYLKKNSFSKLSAIEALINLFNASWYGHKNPSLEDYDIWNSNISAVWNEVMNYEEKNK